MKKLFLALSLCMVGLLGAQDRSYERPVTAQEEKDINFIISTLGSKNELALAAYKSRLEEAGARTDNVHPLRWFEVVFTDERLKAAMRNVKKKGMVYSRFTKDHGESFEQERQRGTINEKSLQQFADAVGIDVELIRPSAESGQWKEFITILIDNVPREGSAKRFDS